MSAYAAPPNRPKDEPSTDSPPMQAGYAHTGGLEMYYEIIASGRPLLLLHGGMSSINTSFEKLRPALSQHRKTIALEQQAHGHTADLDRPLRYEQMAEDTAACLQALELTGVDVFGWSDGGIVALGLAARYPELVRRVAICGAGYGPDAEGPAFKKIMRELSPDNPHIEPFKQAYQEVAPSPQHWAMLIQKCKDMYFAFQGWPVDQLRALKAPLLVMLGDQDFLRPEHALELSRLVPQGSLAVLPATDHSAPITRADWVAAMLNEFLDPAPS
jgi:pimeloyl-ACP methyl ester carboxylesterase